MPYAIETRELTKRFPVRRRYRDMILHPFVREKITALEDVSVQIEHGEVFGLLGPNGAGKTTFVKTLCTLILPTSGSAFVNGHDVTLHGPAIRRMIGYVLVEERSFYWRLTGRQNLLFFAALNNLQPAEGNRRAAEVLELVGLVESADRPVKDYSTGMKQRLAIARGLLTDPEVIFLDEPTRSLDPVAGRDLRRFLKDVLVGQRRRTIMLATNSTQEAEEMCDRIAIIDRGRLKVCETVSEVRRLVSEGFRYELRLREPAASVREQLAGLGLDGAVLSLKSDPFDGAVTVLHLRLTDEGPVISDVIDHMVRLGTRIESCVPQEPSLEDVISRIIG